MAEGISFTFEGALANDHQMNFYEAARFQYAASRLLVKLSQFRTNGRFNKKVTQATNLDIRLDVQAEGSFRINVSAPPPPPEGGESFVALSLASLLAYVAERILSKTDDAEIIEILNGHPQIVDRFGRIDEGDDERLTAIMRALIDEEELRGIVRPDAAEIIQRRISEMARQGELLDDRAQIARIDPAREQKLLAMSAPLLSEMATALRRSANTLQVQSNRDGRRSNILYLNKRMAEEIETSKVDDELTPILCDIIQYNKETGWGKVRLADIGQPVSFNVPSDLKEGMQNTLLRQMGRDQVYLSVYFVRDKAEEPIRLIVVRIIPINEDGAPVPALERRE